MRTDDSLLNSLYQNDALYTVTLLEKSPRTHYYQACCGTVSRPCRAKVESPAIRLQPNTSCLGLIGRTIPRLIGRGGPAWATRLRNGPSPLKRWQGASR